MDATWDILRAVRIAAVVIALGVSGLSAAAADAPAPTPPRPRYELDIALDTAAHRATIRERVTWTNPTRQPQQQVVFNFYPHYEIPEGEMFLLRKTFEMLRLQPSLGIDPKGRHGRVTAARLIAAGGMPVAQPAVLAYEYDVANPCSLRFALPQPVPPGASVTVELDCVIDLPNKQGRWGHWNGVTFLSSAVPLLAFCDDSGWQPMPFVPWAQTWYNEAGDFTATITLPSNEHLACPAVVKSETDLGDGRKRVVTEPFLGRDFALLASARYQEFRGETKLPDGRTVVLKCLAFPEHEFYANEIIKIVGEAIPVYSQWFGPFPYPQFTIAESYFGWNGNECAGLVMIDDRVFGMPHIGMKYVEYLVSHETCHQWWYNMIGTNGYAEPFLDEGAATYFTHRLLDQKNGKNNPFFDWPDGLKWMPNVYRENYRYSGMFAAIRNGQMQPAAQDLPKYGHLYGLFTGAYDRGSKVFGMIEGRLGEAAFLDFTRMLVAKYGWRILRAEDLRRELEAYTGRDWAEFFDRWVYGKGLTDWKVEEVTTNVAGGPRVTWWNQPQFTPSSNASYTTSIIVRQQREFTEPTVLELESEGGASGYGGAKLRVPIGMPQPVELQESRASVVPLGDGAWRVNVETPYIPGQVTVDPDRVLLDADPTNNAWKTTPKFRATPLYTMLDETDLTSDFDRCNYTAGPWIWGATYPDPWYTRSTMLGLRVGANKPQRFRAGAYAAYRTNYRDLILGFDAVQKWEMQETGLNYERRIAGPWGNTDGDGGPQRAVLYHRWTIKQATSLYLPPMIYHEAFAAYQDNFLPFARTRVPGGVRPDATWNVGWHMRANLYTPYWDPERGFWADVVAAVGQSQVPDWTTSGQLRGELAGVQPLPEWSGPLREARVAGRVVGMTAWPDRGLFYPLGGGTLFRGYDLAERQGSSLWVANAELRYPIVRDVEWDCLDHCVGARNLWLVGFYDVGAVYANSRTVGGNVAHALGGGLRMDVAVFSFIERATMRFDFAKTINDNTPFQFWFGIQQAF